MIVWCSKFKNTRVIVAKPDSDSYYVEFRKLHADIRNDKAHFDFSRDFFGRTYTIVSFSLSIEGFESLVILFHKINNNKCTA